MSNCSSRPIISLCIFLLIALCLTYADATRFDIRNNCSFTVWVAAVPVGGHKLEPGQSWPIYVAPGTAEGRIWGRTACSFDRTGRGSCQTGDCDGLLHCRGYGTPPNTLVEYAVDQYNRLEYSEISLIDGFNLPMEVSPDSNSCGNKGTRCTANITEECPNELRAPGGCNDPCTVFGTEEYCCISRNCGPTYFSRFFKERCPNASSYPEDNDVSEFYCYGNDYRVVFCP